MSKSEVGCIVMTWRMWLWWVRMSSRDLPIDWWKLSIDESFLLMKNVFLHIHRNCLLMKVVYWWNLLMKVCETFLMMKVVYIRKKSIDESILLMKVVYWWKLLMELIYWRKLSIDECCLLMKVVYWWKLSTNESCLLMKVVYW